jgi:hypothetical protein
VYKVGDLFIRNSDLQAFASYRGVVESVPLKQVKIGIADVENPEEVPKTVIYIPESENYRLSNKGRKIVVVEYDGMDTSYSIEVSDAPGNADGPGIIIEWGE